MKAYPPVEMEACLNDAIAAVAQKGLKATARLIETESLFITAVSIRGTFYFLVALSF